jgi:hypothetical protein
MARKKKKRIVNKWYPRLTTRDKAVVVVHHLCHQIRMLSKELEVLRIVAARVKMKDYEGAEYSLEDYKPLVTKQVNRVMSKDYKNVMHRLLESKQFNKNPTQASIAKVLDENRQTVVQALRNNSYEHARPECVPEIKLEDNYADKYKKHIEEFEQTVENKEFAREFVKDIKDLLLKEKKEKTYIASGNPHTVVEVAKIKEQEQQREIQEKILKQTKKSAPTDDWVDFMEFDDD